MVFLQAAVSRGGPAFALLELVEARRLELLVSREILAEVREVLLRPKIQARFAFLSENRIDAFLQRIEELTEILDTVPAAFRLERDPGDEPYINLALAGEADFLVTRDRDLLDLAAIEGEQQRELRRLHPRLRILDPAALLKELSSLETDR
jgi:putative PIN family toxin of toxin-antitoxin system